MYKMWNTKVGETTSLVVIGAVLVYQAVCLANTFCWNTMTSKDVIHNVIIKTPPSREI